MFNLPDRCIPLREEAVNKKEYMKFYYAQRNVYFNMGKALAEKAGKTPTEAISAGLVYTLSKFTPVIIPNELIVGFNFGEGERSEYFVPENNEFGRLVCKENGISAEDMELSMMSKENRRLEVLKISDFDSAMESLNILMGAGRVKERREFLFENVDFGNLYN